jgi:hypothetical protein
MSRCKAEAIPFHRHRGWAEALKAKIVGGMGANER